MANEIYDAIKAVWVDGPQSDPYEPPKSQIREIVGRTIQSQHDILKGLIFEANTIYADTATGLAATTVGYDFKVQSDNTSTIAYYAYRNVAGSAVLIAEVPAASALASKQNIGSAIVAAAATTDIGAEAASRIAITGTGGPITSFGNAPAGTMKVASFSDVVTIVHNPALINVPKGNGNLVTEPLDRIHLIATGSSSATVWYITSVQRYSGKALTLPSKAEVGVTALATSALRNTPWRNLIRNPNLDPAEPAKTYSATPTLVAPATEMARHGILQAMDIGAGGTNSYAIDSVFDADSSQQYLFASAYIFSENGADWPRPRGYYYAGATLVANFEFTSYLPLSANERIYYGATQLPERTDLTSYRCGVAPAFTATGCKISGFGLFMRPEAPLTLEDVPFDDWYPNVTRQSGLLQTYRTAMAGGPKPFDGKRIVVNGDSVIQNYGLPDRLCSKIGGTALNAGFGACQMSGESSPTGLKVYKQHFSFVAIASAIAAKLAGTGNFEDQETAADEMISLGGQTPDGENDYRPLVDNLQAEDWNAVDYMLVSYGTNDFNVGKPLGAIGGLDPNTFIGAMEVGLQALFGERPDFRIAFITPMWRHNAPESGGLSNGLADSNVATNKIGLKLSDYQDAIIATAKYYNVPVLRLHENCGINAYNYLSCLPDGLHPGYDLGQEFWASAVGSSMKATYS